MSELLNKDVTLQQHAVELHQKILVSAQLVQQNLWEMGNALKQMRDNKLYKELGYSNFEDYCNSEIGFTRVQAHKYIAIVENINLENVNSSLHLGVTKLSLLASISETEQKQLVEKVDLENTTVKELKSEVEKLKSEKEHLFNDNVNLFKKNRGNQETIKKLKDQVKELESREPEVVTVIQESDSERLLKETIKSLERESFKRNEELEQQYRADEQAVRQMLEKEKQEALAELTEKYEEKLKNANEKDNNYEFFCTIFRTVQTLLTKMVLNSRDEEKYNSKFDDLLERISYENRKKLLK